MPPQEFEKRTLSAVEGRQSLFIIRHGDRFDYAHPEWSKTSSRPDDPPLSALGQQQARETGLVLDSILSSEGIAGDDITWLSSPFLRCLQTSHEAIDAFQKLDGRNDLNILPEYSVFEWDGHNGKLHKSLPDLGERKHYFPRVDVAYESLFVPDLPEPRTEFHSRCQRSVQAINRRYLFRPDTAVIVVSHAAGCVGMSAAATNQALASITPAAPCSIYRMTRTSDTPVWSMDAHDAVDSMNGHTAHLSDLGSSTMPWNNFGDKKVFRGYTGPATSRFAPQGFASREEL